MEQWKNDCETAWRDALLRRIPETDNTASHVYTYKSK